MEHYSRSRSFKVVETGTNRHDVCHFVFVVNSDLSHVFYRFKDSVTKTAEIIAFVYPRLDHNRTDPLMLPHEI